jgi:O-antigen/teichoic acid export membrane protein
MLNWNTINSYVLNGVGKIKLQLYLYIIAVIIFIPLAIFMGKQTGITGVVYAMCIVLLPGTILHPIQCIKIVNQKATGIWNK